MATMILSLGYSPGRTSLRPTNRLRSPHRQRALGSWLLAASVAAGGSLLGAAAAQAGPVVCTTSIEAPDMGSLRPYGAGPVEVTRCGPVVTVPEVMRSSYYSYRAPFARGVDITHQITDALGIAMGGIEGNRFMGFGFPDQAIVWDGSAVETTYRDLIQTQHDPTPVRTADQSTPFGTSVVGGAVGGAAADGAPRAVAPGYTSNVRGLSCDN
jgi:hypothetical protein